MRLMTFYLFGLFNSLKSSLIAALMTITAFLAPIGDLLMFMSLMVVADFVTGVIAAKYKGQVRSSSRMFNSVIKLTTYLGVITFAFIFDERVASLFHTQLFNNILSFFLEKDSIEMLTKFKLAAAVSFIMLIREAKSIDENWYAIRGWSFLDTGMQVTNNIKELILNIIQFKNQIRK